MSHLIFLALAVPGKTADMDPDEVADDIADQLSTPGNRVLVSGIPSPQWLTRETMATLRVNATTLETPTPHPLALDLLEMLEALPAEHRRSLAHAVCCAPCRRGLINIVQSLDEYPDLFAGDAQ